MKLAPFAIAATAVLCVSAAISAASPAGHVQSALLPSQVSVVHRTAKIRGKSISYRAEVGRYRVIGPNGKDAAELVATTYLREAVDSISARPVVFVFNGGPSAAAITLHHGVGPRQPVADEVSSIAAEDNADSLLDQADLVVFDPADTGFSRVVDERQRPWLYSVAGDAESLAQLVSQWLHAHGRESSPRYLLGESYGSIRAVAAADLLTTRSLPLDGLILLGNSIFLQETSGRSHNIVATAVTLPLYALTAAHHGKGAFTGLSHATLLEKSYRFAMSRYLPALALGGDLPVAERNQIAAELERFTGIEAGYFRNHGLAIAKTDFAQLLVPGKTLDRNDYRIAVDKPSVGEPAASADGFARENAFLDSYLRGELKAEIPGRSFVTIAPRSFQEWDWGSACSAYLQAPRLCDPASSSRSVFADYDWPDVLAKQFAGSKFRVLVVASEFDGLSSIGTQFYLRSQLGYPADRFFVRSYAAGHATTTDSVVKPLVLRDIETFLSRETPSEADPR